MSTESAKLFIVFGASDPEIAYAKQLCNQLSIPYGDALYQGASVTPGTAYKADGVSQEIPDNYNIVFFECKVQGISPDFVLDHHDDTHPRSVIGPEEYYRGSSLGQLIETIVQGDNWKLDHGHFTVSGEASSLTLSDEYLYVMAADHCPADAYKGKCPYIDIGKLSTWREESRAKFQNVPVDVIRNKITRAIEKISSFPRIFILGEEIIDARGQGVVPELPEASLRLCMPIMYGPIPTREGRDKCGILGASPELIQAWLDRKIEPSKNLRDLYGVPKRGYAGGYRE
ncbi:MAG: hypothetical protein D6732_09455 [Methanobacteriota archaeon]|nr:MAG: hypothetical protein D6732_09455 [Euryarchaeota archaeon]